LLSILDILSFGKCFVKDKKFIITNDSHTGEEQKTYVEIKMTQYEHDEETSTML